jgi:hypothetical protein
VVVSIRTEHLRLRVKERVVVTVEESVLRTEMENLESDIITNLQLLSRPFFSENRITELITSLRRMENGREEDGMRRTRSVRTV